MLGVAEDFPLPHPVSPDCGRDNDGHDNAYFARYFWQRHSVDVVD